MNPYNDIITYIIEKYYNDIYRFCYYHLENKSDAEDCTQEVFMVLHAKSHSIVIGKNIKSWLYKTAQNKVKEYTKKNKNKKRTDTDISEINNEEALSYNELFSDDDEYSVPEFVQSLGFLSESEKQLILDYFYYEYPTNEIAGKNNITPNAVYIRITRIKEKIINHLGENGHIIGV